MLESQLHSIDLEGKVELSVPISQMGSLRSGPQLCCDFHEGSLSFPATPGVQAAAWVLRPSVSSASG